MSETVLVTGATGFIGTQLCKELDTNGYEIRGMRRTSSDPSSLSKVDIDWYVGDIRDGDVVRSAVDGCDYVCHLAGTSLMSADAETVFDVNVRGTETVLEACQDAGVDRFVFTSTAGTRRTDGVADETDVAEPLGAYQQSKSRAEQLVHDHVGRGLDAVVVHPTSVFGPGDENFTGRLLALAMDPKLFVYLPGGVSFVSVRDAAQGHVDALERGRAGEHYILGGENLRYREALQIIARAADGTAPRLMIPPFAVRALGPVAELLDRTTGKRVFPFNTEMAELATKELFCSSRKASEQIGYSYEPLEMHVDAAIEWHRARRW